jgi:uncharacterized protein YbcV (DUF1398 family)
MDAHLKEIAQSCLDAAEGNSMTFPQIVGRLMQAGFESYAMDFRRADATYYQADGGSVVFATHRGETPVAAALDKDAIQSAIREAQQLVPGYSYKGFCAKVMVAGCSGYIVSFSGRRAVYFGRTAETHVELFPQ